MLVPADNISLGSRLPIILIHGNDGEKDSSPYGWDKYVKAIKTNSVPKRKYKAYLLRWDSGSYAGQLAGEKVNYLITLATPHHGSPGADPMWVTFSIDNYFKSNQILAAAISTAYYDVVYEPKSHPFLTWDDWEGIVTDEDVCWDSSLMGKGYCARLYQNVSLKALNGQEKYSSKIVAFGGNNFNGESLSLIAEDPRIYVYDISCKTCDHRKLDLSTALMAIMPSIPNGYSPGMAIPTARPFQINDGMVPLVSALFLKAGSQGVFRIAGRGALSFSQGRLNSYSQVGEVVVVNGNADHLDFLDKDVVVNQVGNRLIKLP